MIYYYNIVIDVSKTRNTCREPAATIGFPQGRRAEVMTRGTSLPQHRADMDISDYGVYTAMILRSLTSRLTVVKYN